MSKYNNPDDDNDNDFGNTLTTRDALMILHETYPDCPEEEWDKISPGTAMDMVEEMSSNND